MKVLPPLGLVAALAASSVAGCVVTETTGPARPEPPELVLALPIGAWRVEADGALAGFLVRYEPEQRPEDGYWSVRNPWHQELGLIDALGRYWRFEPHVGEPRLEGSGTVVEGAQRLLGLAGAPELIPIPLAALAG